MGFAYIPDIRSDLPHDEIPLAVSIIIENGLREAWYRLLTNPPANFDILTAQEDTITAEFYKMVVNTVLTRRLVDGFNREVFTITREAKYRNFDDSKPDNMPDLAIIFLQDRPSFMNQDVDGLFIECKPIDRDHSVGFCYCGEGLIRFIDGTYAWAMKDAMMVGYIRGTYTIATKLHKGLDDRAAHDEPNKVIKTLQYPYPSSELLVGREYEAVHISVHKRGFIYPQTQQAAPPITVRHLWLRRD